MNKIGVIIAVKEEAKAILSEHTFKWEKLSNMLYQSNEYQLSLVLSGIGKAFAVHALDQLPKDCDLILSMGTSGGLSSEKPGTIFLVNEFIEHDMDVTGLGFPLGLTPFSPMKDVLITSATKETTDFVAQHIKKAGFEFSFGRAIAGDSFLHNAIETETKRKHFQAQLADMETAAIAKIASISLQKQMLAIRYISDNANHDAANNWQANVTQSSKVFSRILQVLCQNNL